MNLEFAWPWFFALIVLPVLVYFLFRPVNPAQERFLKVPFYRMVANQGGRSVSGKRRRWRLLLAVPAWLCLVVAAARPQWVGEAVTLPVSGRDLMLAVDLSMSMQTEDMLVSGRQIDRLSAVKRVAGAFIEGRKGDRLGLILFGDRAYLQSPLTFDRKTVRAFLEESVLGLAGEKTAMGDAIGLAVKRLRNSREDNRVLILLTDGANTAGNIEPERAAQLANREGIRIYTVGVGADYRTVRDLFGQHRVRGGDLDEATLKTIAGTTGGQYFRARDLDELDRIYKQLDKIEPVADDTMQFRPVDELFQWPLAASLFLALLIPLLGEASQSFRRGRPHAR